MEKLVDSSALPHDKKDNDASLGGVSDHARTQTPGKLASLIHLARDIGLEEGVIRIVLATYTSTFLMDDTPLWIMLVGPPSSNKTTTVDLLRDAPKVNRVDILTPNAFISGKRETEKEKVHDLLNVLDGKCFIVKEYSALLGRSDEVVKQILSELTAIYDGEFIKHSSERGTKKYTSRFSHLGCVTSEALSKRYKYMSQIGPRFLFLRMDALSSEQKRKGLKDILSGKKITRTKEHLSQIATGLCQEYHDTFESDIDLSITTPPHFEEEITLFAMLMARARGVIQMEQVELFAQDGTAHVSYEAVEVQIEEPFRACKQLLLLAKSLAYIDGRREVSANDLILVRRVVFSSMTPRRAHVLEVFHSYQYRTTAEVAECLNRSERTVRRHLDEMLSLGVLTADKEANDLARVYRVAPDFTTIFEASRVMSAMLGSAIVPMDQSGDSIASIPF